MSKCGGKKSHSTVELTFKSYTTTKMQPTHQSVNQLLLTRSSLIAERLYGLVLHDNRQTHWSNGVSRRSHWRRERLSTVVTCRRPRSNVCERGERSQNLALMTCYGRRRRAKNARFLKPSPAFDRGRPPSTAVTCRKRPQWERHLRLQLASSALSTPRQWPFGCRWSFSVSTDSWRTFRSTGCLRNETAADNSL